MWLTGGLLDWAVDIFLCVTWRVLWYWTVSLVNTSCMCWGIGKHLPSQNIYGLGMFLFFMKFLFLYIILFRLWFFSVSILSYRQTLRLINTLLSFASEEQRYWIWQGASFICLVWVHEYSYVFIYVWTG